MQYVSVEHQKAIAPRYRVASIIVAVLAMTVILYMVMGRFMTPGVPVPGSETWQKSIYGGVIILGLIIVILRRVLMSGVAMNRAAAGGVSHVLRNLMTVTIVIASLAELIAVLGLIFYLLTADYQYSWRLGVVSLFLLVYAFPRRKEWEHLVTRSVEAHKKEHLGVFAIIERYHRNGETSEICAELLLCPAFF